MIGAGVGVVSDQEDERNGNAEADVDDHEKRASGTPGAVGLGLQGGTGSTRAAPHGDEEDAKPEEDPESDEEPGAEHSGRGRYRAAKPEGAKLRPF